MNSRPTTDIIDSYPLTPMQQGMLFQYVSSPNAGIDIEQIVGTFEEALQIDLFRAAWERIADRHPALRTSFHWNDADSPRQEVHAKVQPAILLEDWTPLLSAEQAEKLTEYLAADRSAGFDLTRAPLFRLFVTKLAPARFQCVWTVHHILMDGRSFTIALRELFAIYTALIQHAEPTLSFPSTFRAHIDWLTQQDWARSEHFWKETLKGFTSPTTLQTIRPVARSCLSPVMGEQWAQVSQEVSSRLYSRCAELDITASTVVHAAWAYLIGQYSRERDVVFGTVRACRHTPVLGSASIVGLLINTVPLRVKIQPDVPLDRWLKGLREQEFRIRPHEHTPLYLVQEWSDLHVKRALFDTLIMFEHGRLNESLRGTLGEGRAFELKEHAPYPLLLEAYGEKCLFVKIVYDRCVFDDDTAKRMLQHYEYILEQIGTRTTINVSSLSLLSLAERKRVLSEWNNTATLYPKDSCIQNLFEKQVSATPDAVALSEASFSAPSAPAAQVTYAELNRRANKLAHFLREIGVGPSVFVGLFMARSIEAIIAILAILKAGGSYVPLDPTYPRPRLAYMLKDTGAPVLLTDRAIGDWASFNGRVVRPDLERATIDLHSAEDCEQRNSPDDLAYVMYTSGSTGSPKGVCVPHRAVVRLVKQTNYVTLSAEDVFLQFAPTSFDASTFEIWGCLLNGGRLVIVPPELPTLEQFGHVIQRQRVTVLWLTAALFHEMVDHRLEDLRGVRQLLAGGEALSVTHVRKALQNLPSTQLINGYGPTENTTFTCCHSIRAETIGHSVPIGRPIANTTVYILDDHLQPVPIGIPGELYTGGDGLARGYLNAPELTSAKFIPNPFNDGTSDRLYRVGDLARFLPSGDIEFLGRLDDQIKIRGFRIELGEIENELLKQPGICAAAASVREEQSGTKAIVAHVVPRPGTTPNFDAIRAALQQTLPEYMVPSAFGVIAKMPLTHNGKVDRKALPDPAAGNETPVAHLAPRSTLQKQMCEIWQETLRVPHVGIHENFFSLGGHSLLTLRIIAAIQERLHLGVQPQTLIEHPTVAALCEVLSGTHQIGAVETPGTQHSAPVRNAALEAIATLAANRRESRKQIRTNTRYAMKESILCRFALAPFYHIERKYVRSLIQYLILKFEHGEMYTITLRKLYSKYFDINIGDYTECRFDVNTLQRKTIIGRYTGIYPTVVIRNADHPRNTISTHAVFYHPSQGYNKGYELPRVAVEIGNDVWIGHNATILYPTKRIGDGAVIAAGSVVVEDVPPYAIVGGYPAKVLRYRFSRDTIDELLQTRWWQLSLGELEPIKHHFERPLDGAEIR